MQKLTPNEQNFVFQIIERVVHNIENNSLNNDGSNILGTDTSLLIVISREDFPILKSVLNKFKL